MQLAMGQQPRPCHRPRAPCRRPRPWAPWGQAVGVAACHTGLRALREALMQPRNAESRAWRWKEKLSVHYAVAESKLPSDGPAVVLLHGFGVAGFHYEQQFRALSEAGYTTYAMDNVGAGLSWPLADPAPGGPQEEVPGSQWGFGPSPAEGFEDLVIGEAKDHHAEYDAI